MIASEKNTAAYKKVNTIKVAIEKQDRADGSIILYSTIPLEPHAYRLTERLKHWAAVAPNRIFIGQRSKVPLLTSGGFRRAWDTLTYAETFAKVKSIAQALLHKRASSSQPIAILSENSIEHGLLALAAMHIGIPYSAIAPAYSLRSADFDKLKHVISLLTPGLVFVQDAKKYEKALLAACKGIEIVSPLNPPPTGGDFRFTHFDELLQTPATDAVESGFNAVQPQTIAKILFTSGSTGCRSVSLPTQTSPRPWIPRMSGSSSVPASSSATSRPTGSLPRIWR